MHDAPAGQLSCANPGAAGVRPRCLLLYVIAHYAHYASMKKLPPMQQDDIVKHRQLHLHINLLSNQPPLPSLVAR
jgi:hypothetical protein